MFKLGINTWSYPKTLSLEKQIAHAAKTGFEAFEPPLTQEDLELHSKGELRKKWKAIREAAETHGIKIPSVATGLYWRYNWVVEPYKALKVLEAEAQAANIVGADLILVVPGTGVPELGYEEMIERVASSLGKAEKIVRNYGVRVGLENVWNRFLAGPLEFRMLLDKLDPDVFGAYFDAGNTLPHSLPEHWIRVLAKRIFQVHVKGFSMAELRFGIPLFGDINWKQVRRALEEVGYQGYVLAEVPPYRGDPYKAVEDTYTSLEKIFG